MSTTLTAILNFTKADKQRYMSDISGCSHKHILKDREMHSLDPAYCKHNAMLLSNADDVLACLNVIL